MKHARCTVALTISTFFVFAIVASATTAAPTATGFGTDDWNTSTLNPFGASYLTATPNWLGSALPNSASQNNAGWGFNNAAQWTFTFANATVAAATLQSFNYSAWVVSNDGYNLPNGNPAQTYNFANADVGGANYTLNYVPGANDPGGANSNTALANVHFLQIVQATSNYGNDQTGQVTSSVTQYFIDNNGSNATPWYDGNFTFGYAGNNDSQKWIDDSPYRCENQGAGGCNADGTPNLLSITWQADTFLAVDTGANANTQNNVLLYGGRNWGFMYTDTDAPEPSALWTAALGLNLLIIGVRRRRSRCLGRHSSTGGSGGPGSEQLPVELPMSITE